MDPDLKQALLIIKVSFVYNMKIIIPKNQNGFIWFQVKAGEGKRLCWQKSADEINDKIRELLKAERGIRSTSNVVHIECVKSYGPRIYHLVIDLQCLIMVDTE